MDASDIIRMRNANTQFSYYAKNVLAKNKCYSDKYLDISGGCPLTFSSYSQKYLLKEGARDLSGYTPTIIVPNNNSKMAYYVLQEVEGYSTYQYRFYDGWGPLIDSGISTNYNINNSYYSLGFQYAHFYDEDVNVRLQILDSTGKIINTLAYQSISGPAGYYNGPRYGILYYETPSGVNTFVLIDPQTNTIKTFTPSRPFTGYIGITGSDASFLLADPSQYYLYIWPFGAAQPYVAFTCQNYYFPDTPEIMDHVAVAVASGDNGDDIDTIKVLLANGTLLSYTLPTSYFIYFTTIYYYGINNSRLYFSAYNVSSGGIDIYLFTLTEESFMNPIIDNSILHNDFSIIAYTNTNQDYLTAQTNNLSIYIYNSQPQNIDYYDATVITYFDGGSSNSNNFSLVSDYVGLNSNGVTLIGLNTVNSNLYSCVITHNGVTSNIISASYNYDCTYGTYYKSCSNLNDYFYYEIYSGANYSNHGTEFHGFVIDVSQNSVVATYTYVNADDFPTIAVSGNSLARSGTDTRLAYFNPTVNSIDNVTIERGNLYPSYPDLATGCIFTINNDSSFNIITSNTYTNNINTGGFAIFANDIATYTFFSDNFNVLGQIGDQVSVYNLNSNGSLTISDSVQCDNVNNISVQNTPSNIMWAFQQNYDGDSLTYINYNILNNQMSNYIESNYLYNYTLRTNNYYTFYN